MAILNKDNNGYVTPEEFNLFAKQAQLELFEEYFYDYNKWVIKQNRRLANSGYTDIPKQLAEVIDMFSTAGAVSYVTVQIDSTGVLTGSFSAGDTVSQAGSGATAVVVSYNTSLTSPIKILRLNTVVGTFNTTGLITGSAPGTLAAPLAVTAGARFQLPDDWYTLISVEYNSLEVERIMQHKLISLVNSNITAPTVGYPAYYQNGATTGVGGNSITIYPTTITSGVTVSYVRYPLDPKWTYTTVSGSPVFNQSATDYQDFELPAVDQNGLVLKILQYAGINIRDMAVAKAAAEEEIITNQQES